MAPEAVTVPRGTRSLCALVRRERPLHPGEPSSRGNTPVTSDIDEGGPGDPTTRCAGGDTTTARARRATPDVTDVRNLPDVPDAPAAPAAPAGTILLEAGLGLHSSLWRPLLDLVDLDPRLDGWRLVATDRAGLGTSERAPDPRPLSAVMADLDAVVRALCTPPLVLVGHSWGGTLVRLWCAAHPGEASGAVLVDASFERGPEHHRSSALGWLGRGADVLAVDALEAFGSPLGRSVRDSAHARTQEMQLFGTSLDLLESLESKGQAWMPADTEVVTTSRTRGHQLDAQRRFAGDRGFRLRAASTRKHLIPLRDPETVRSALVDVLPRTGGDITQ